MKIFTISTRFLSNRIPAISHFALFLLIAGNSFALAFGEEGQFRTAPSSSDYFPSNIPGGNRSEMGSLSSDSRPFVGDVSMDENSYKIGPGDLFQFFVESSSFERQVNPEGNILITRIGAVHVEGLTLREAKSLLLDKLGTAYKRSNCFVNLSRPKLMRVFVTGAVQSPGVQEIPGNYRLIEAINRAGGYTPQAQKNKILIISGADTIKKVDLREFILAGNLDANPYLCQGCLVQVPFLDYTRPWVTIRHDSVTAFIQTGAGESAQEIVRKAFMFQATPMYTTILVKEKDGRNRLLLPGEEARYVPESEAVIEMVYARHEVFVGGAVQSPGFQNYRSDRKVVEYISRAGVLTTSKVPDRVLVIHRDGKRELMPIQGSDLRPGDVVLVKQNAEQKFLLYTPILLSIVSLTLVIVQLGAL
jgi:protein involved in polysaccharide export with SLBB domain